METGAYFSRSSVPESRAAARMACGTGVGTNGTYEATVRVTCEGTVALWKIRDSCGMQHATCRDAENADNSSAVWT